MKVRDILQHKGGDIFSIATDASLADVVAMLIDRNCGSLLVVDGQRPVGIITERDILRTCATESRTLGQIQVKEKMSTNLLTGSAGQSLGDVMGVLTEKRIRHLPIVDEGQLIGIVSIGDVVKAQHAALAQENHYLKSYIQS
jgi:CBS domain-containing protein